MDDNLDMGKLLELRKLTTAIAEQLQGQLKAYLSTLQPLFAPERVLGGHVRPGAGGLVKGADKAFDSLKSAYLALAGTKLYNLPKSLESPVSIATARPELARVEYAYEASDGGAARAMTAVSPLKWVLTYGSFTPARLGGLLAQGDNVNERELIETLQHLLIMELVLAQQSGLKAILAALGFTVASEKLPAFGELTFTTIAAPIKTKRPPDKIMLQIAEISGSPQFEEIVRIEDIVAMKTPLKDQLLETARTHAPQLLAAAGG